MTDETREELSAYLDNALPQEQRRDLEARLAASAELRGALEDLRSVSRLVKDLPKEPLPPGFMTRFSARRARGDAPRADWVFLPPAARPVVGALSFGVIALMIWSKVGPAPEPVLHPDDAARVFGAANAPVAQLDLSRQMITGAASSMGGGSGGSDAKSLEIAGAAAPRDKATDKLAVIEKQEYAPAPAANADMAEMKAAAKVNGIAATRGASARAAGAPVAAAQSAPGAAPSAEPQLTDRTRTTMSEEERSARNEQLFQQLEGQKKDMGMRVLPKDEDSDGAHEGFLGLREPPSAPAIRAPRPSLLKDTKKKGSLAAEAAGAPTIAGKPTSPAPAGRLAPDAALVFNDAGSLASSWVLLGLPGDPPTADYVNGRVIVIKPSNTKILSVTPGADAVSVVFRALEQDEESDPAKDRVAPLPASPKNVLIYDATPR